LKKICENGFKQFQAKLHTLYTNIWSRKMAFFPIPGQRKCYKIACWTKILKTQLHT
jgi:hypothetical protein